MTKPRATFICPGCGTHIPNLGARERYCSLPCACWSRIQKAGEDDCWPWIGCKTSFGYGNFRFHGRLYFSHKVAYEDTHGPIPGLEGCHRCDNPTCCNPSHIFPGTHAENLADMRSKGRGALPPAPKSGEGSCNAKITDAMAIAIRAAHAGGLSIAKIAEANPISRTSVGRIIRRETWAHI